MVKTYHPDKNPDNQDWAHEKMVILNNCYKVLLEYRSQNPDIEGIAQPESPRISTNVTDPAFPYYFSESIQLFLSSICIYFEYGLDNYLLRKDGPRRFRFRECLKTLFKSIELIMEIKKMDLDDESRLKFESVMKFLLLFYQDLKKETHAEYQGAFEREFNNNNKLLSKLIQAAFLPDRSNRQIVSRDNFYLCYMTYMKLMNGSVRENQKKDVLLKISLLDALMDFIETRNSGSLSDYFD
jgi:hypothetical protein